MEEFKGTPAPWTGKDVHICKQDDAGLQIGFLMTNSDERKAEGAANAHLIAAAPEVLEALRQLRDYVEDVCCVSPEDCDKEHPLMLATSTINKALGK